MKLKQMLSLALLLSLLLEPILPPAAPMRASAASLTDPRVLEVMQRVNAKWQRDHLDPGDNQWGRAVYHMGNLAHYAMSGDAQSLDYSQQWAEQNHWLLNGGCTTVFADNQAAGQVYLDLDEQAHDPQHLACITQSIQQSMTWGWVEIDLGTVQSINQIKVYPFTDRAYRYYVQVKSTPDGAYTQIVNRAGNTQGGAVIEDNVASVDARFVRLWFIGAYGYVENWVSIQEVTIAGPAAPGVNLALNKTVTCSSQPEPQNPCANLVDGNLTSRWSASFPLGHTEASMNWWWIDALYMAMPVYARLGRLYNDATYAEVMAARYHDAKVERKLYDASEGLWYRDDSYLYPGAQTPAGNQVFWSRGNGWVFAAHARTLEALAPTDPQRAQYEATFQAMAAALKKRQNPQGYWNASLADPNHFPGPESSGTAFFTYGLAWGINHGLLPRTEYAPTIAKAWRWLVNNAVHVDGLLGYVQPIGGEPAAAGYNDTSDYGVGAFLLAGREVNTLALPDEDTNKSYLPFIATPVVEEQLLFRLENSCQIDRFFTTDHRQTIAVTPACTLTNSIVFEAPGVIRIDKLGGVVVDLARLKSSTGAVLAQQPSAFYRIEAVLEDAGQTNVQAAIGLFDSLWEAPAPGGVHGISVGMKDAQHTYWYTSTQFVPITNTTALDPASNDFLTKFDIAKRDRPVSGAKDVKIDLYVTPNGTYPVINDINWGSFPTLKAGSFTYTQTNDLRYVVLSKWDKGGEPVRFKSLQVVQLVSQVDSVDQVNAHFIKQAIEGLLPQIPISPSECNANNSERNSSNALMQAWLYREYDYYFKTNHQSEVQKLVDTYLHNLPTCVDQAVQAYASAKHDIYDCTKDPNEQLGTVFWVNHTYINPMHWEPRAIYALSGYLTATQLATFQNTFGRLVDESMKHVQADGSFPAAGACFVDDTFAEEISWLLMTYAGFYVLFPTDQPRADKLLDEIKFLGFIHLSDDRTLTEVFPDLKFTFLGDEYRNFRSRYTYVENSASAPPSNGLIDNHGFHPSLHYAIGIVGAAALVRNLLEIRGITTEQVPTIVNNMDVIYRDSILGYLNFKTLRHARFVSNPRLSWCYQNGPRQQDRYQYNADHSLIVLFNGCSTPSGVEDWGLTFANYAVAAIYGDETNQLTFARSVYFNNYPGVGELFCNGHIERCSTNPIIYTYVLNAVAFGKDSRFTP